MTWEGRCYSNGIPDDLPRGVMRSNRVPSYKAIAIAILSNDHNLYGIGFAERQSKTVDLLIQLSKNNERVSVSQYDMFAA